MRFVATFLLVLCLGCSACSKQQGGPGSAEAGAVSWADGGAREWETTVDAAATDDGGTNERTIVIVPMGQVDEASVSVVAKALSQRVHASVRLGNASVLPASAWFAPRKRWRADELLDSLATNMPTGAWRIVGVTAAEISRPTDEGGDWRIGGRGTLDGETCVLSTWIYRKHFTDQATYDRRLADLAVHEFGHTLGLDHCETRGCVMADAQGKALDAADTSTTVYCDKCRRQAGTSLKR